jgi:hypothetical protein
MERKAVRGGAAHAGGEEGASKSEENNDVALDDSLSETEAE